MTTTTGDKLADAKAQGQAQFDSIREMVEALQDWEAAAKADGWEPYTDKFGVGAWRDPSDGATFAGTARQLCEFHDISVERSEDAERAIHEDALSVEVRGDWLGVNDWHHQNHKPAEYQILLCTGGPACRIVGTLDEHCEPETAIMEVQDWFQPWTAFYPRLPGEESGLDPNKTGDAQEVMLAYARCFWFGE